MLRTTPCSHRSMRGFTLIELLVVISIIALLVSILLPALGSARKTAQQMKSNTQLRGIHQGSFIHAEENDGFYPGVTSSYPTNASGWVNGNDIATFNGGGDNAISGAIIPARWCILLEGKYVAPEYLRSPAEINASFTSWESSGSYGRINLLSSYALPQLRGNHVLVHPNGVAHESRVNAYTSSDLTSDTPMASDRLLDTPGFFWQGVTTHMSLWGTQPGDWRGGMAFNDNHVEFFKTSGLDRRFSIGGTIKAEGLLDNIFTSSTDPLHNRGTDLSVLGDNADWKNVAMVVKNANVATAHTPDYN